MKTLFLAITLNIVALSSPFWSLYAQEVRQPKGIVIYDPSKLGDKFGQAKIYSQMTPHSISTDIVTTDGESIKIVGDQLRDHVGFPSIESSPKLWRTVADKLEELAPKYPLAKNVLLEQATIARNKFETLTKIAALESLRKQRIEALKDHRAKQIGRVITFKDNVGESYENVKLEAIEPDGITISDGGAQKQILFTELSKEIQNYLGYDPDVAAEMRDNREFILDGRVIRGEIKQVFPHALQIATENGFVRVPLNQQNENIKKEFAYDPIAAAEFSKAEAQRLARLNAKIFNIYLIIDEAIPLEDIVGTLGEVEGEPVFLGIIQASDEPCAVQFAKDLAVWRQTVDAATGPIRLQPNGEWKAENGKIIPYSPGRIYEDFWGKGYISPTPHTYENEFTGKRDVLKKIIIFEIDQNYFGPNMRWRG